MFITLSVGAPYGQQQAPGGYGGRPPNQPGYGGPGEGGGYGQPPQGDGSRYGAGGRDNDSGQKGGMRDQGDGCDVVLSSLLHYSFKKFKVSSLLGENSNFFWVEIQVNNVIFIGNCVYLN